MRGFVIEDEDASINVKPRKKDPKSASRYFLSNKECENGRLHNKGWILHGELIMIYRTNSSSYLW